MNDSFVMSTLCTPNRVLGVGGGFQRQETRPNASIEISRRYRLSEKKRLAGLASKVNKCGSGRLGTVLHKRVLGNARHVTQCTNKYRIYTVQRSFDPIRLLRDDGWGVSVTDTLVSPEDNRLQRPGAHMARVLAGGKLPAPCICFQSWFSTVFYTGSSLMASYYVTTELLQCG